MFVDIQKKKVKVHRNLTHFKAHNPVVTIGTFDGVHRGHQVVISRLKEFAREYNGETVIFTFHPHPRLVTSPEETESETINNLR